MGLFQLQVLMTKVIYRGGQFSSLLCLISSYSWGADTQVVSVSSLQY